ncbi:hypothetical protein AB6A40_008416 [Gnathostoma spinigerum]|uniref:Uncharacterized protein n=1 Tax=Gnathostoma spinigerum TaxID=75299 RepID=A0ABD6EYD4_9BILA
MSRRVLYKIEEELREAKALGIGVISEKAQMLLWSLLTQKSSVKSHFSDLNVALFNMHSVGFAEKLLQKKVNSLCLVESAISNSKIVKDFARKKRKEDGALIEAYRANFESLFTLHTAKRPYKVPGKLLFGDRSFIEEKVNPLRLSEQSEDDESGDRNNGAPVIIGTLPTPNQQASMLTSLLTMLLVHHSNINRDTLFKYGVVELITFLSAG